MVTNLIVLFIMAIIAPSQLAGYGLSALLVSSQYVFVSVLGTGLKMALQNIGTKIYASKWYFLGANDRKVVLKIMMISQKSLTLKVGPFVEANLERLTGVRFITTEN